MRFYLLDWSYCIPPERSRVILFGTGNMVKNKEDGEEILWYLDSPPFEVIKRLRIKHEI